MSAIVSSTTALSVLFGLNWDRILFLGAVVLALILGAAMFSLFPEQPTYI